MKPTILFILTTAAVLASDAPSQDSKKLQETLIARENQMAEAWKKKDAKTIKSLMPEDYLEINPFGRMTKADVFEQIYPHIEVTDNSGKDYKLSTPTKDTAILTYQFHEKGKYKGKEYSLDTLVSAMYVNREGRWDLVFWQMTEKAKQ